MTLIFVLDNVKYIRDDLDDDVWFILSEKMILLDSMEILYNIRVLSDLTV